MRLAATTARIGVTMSRLAKQNACHIPFMTAATLAHPRIHTYELAKDISSVLALDVIAAEVVVLDVACCRIMDWSMVGAANHEIRVTKPPKTSPNVQIWDVVRNNARMLLLFVALVLEMVVVVGVVEFTGVVVVFMVVGRCDATILVVATLRK
jgi:hypothetical protein